MGKGSGGRQDKGEEGAKPNKPVERDNSWNGLAGSRM